MRVVRLLYTGWAARTHPAAVQWVVGVALDLLGPPLDNADDRAAAGVALLAGSRVPVLVCGQHVLSQADPALGLELGRRVNVAAGEHHGAHGPRGGQELAAGDAERGRLDRGHVLL